MTDRVRQQGTGLDEATLLTRLREAFFTHIDEGDSDDVINGRSDRVLLAHLALGRQRTPGTAVWRVYRPSGSEGLGAAVQIVTDDMSLLVESVTAMLNRQGVGISQFAHPILTVERDDSGNLMSLGDSGIQESWMHVQLDSEVEDSALDAIEAHLGKVLADVRQVVGDTPDMKALQLRVADELESAAETASGRITPEEFSDTARLLRWMADGNYAVLGYRRFEGTKDGSRTVAGSGLGVLRSDAVTEGPMSLPPVADLPDRPLLVLTQGSFPATVHRAVYPYFVGVSILDDEGNIVGEHRFLGVFTVVALHENVLAIPLIERRVREVIARAGVDLHSYSGQAMLEVIQSFPRTELFSSDAETLFETVHAVHSIGLRRQVRLFVREDTFGRFVSCLVYLPPRPVHDEGATGDAKPAVARIRTRHSRLHRPGYRERSCAVARDDPARSGQ